MKLHTPNTAVIVILAIALIVPTGAVLSGGVDFPWEDHRVGIKPADGPNGQYAAFVNGELQIDLSDPGINSNGETTIRDILVITNDGKAANDVWITHNGSKHILFEVDGRSIQGEENKLTIQPKAELFVSFSVNTTQVGSETVLLEEFELHAVETNPPPTITSFAVTSSGSRDLTIAIESDEQLGPDPEDLGVTIDLDGTTTGTLTRADFTETGSGPYSYTASIQVSADGTYSATLTVAKDADGADGAQGETESVTISTGGSQQVTTPQVQTPTATPEPTPTATPTATATPPTPTPIPTTVAPTTPTPVEPDDTGEVEVEVGEEDTDDGETPAGAPEGVTVRDVDIDELSDTEQRSEIRTRPKAVADAEVRTKTDVTGQIDERRKKQLDERVKAAGADALVSVNEDVVLSGARSIVGSMEAIDRDRRIVRAVDVTVPAERRNEPGTVRIEVTKSKLGSTDPANARMAHLTAEGWQLLATRIVSETDTSYVFEARTPGFSPFAVFADNAIEYSWTVNEQTVSGQEIETRFEKPGIYNATLTVTDSFGQSDSASSRILVNDPPEVEIEVPGNLTAGQPIALRANVTDEIGNATVTWSFPDGSRQVGDEVSHTFESGDQTVRVVVEDEFGATAEGEATFTVNPAAGDGPIIDRIAREVPFSVRAAGVVLLSIAVVLLARRLVTGWSLGGLRGVLAASRRDRGPRIVICDDPSVDVRNRQFVIGELRVEDADGDLATIEIEVEDHRGRPVAHKTIDLLGEEEYHVTDVIIPAISRVYVREDGDFILRIRAEDTRHLTDDMEWLGLRATVPDPT